MRKLIITSLLVLALPTAAAAEREVTALVGYRGGSFELTTGIVCIAIAPGDCPSHARAESDATIAYGAIVDLPLRRALDLELLVNRQPSRMQLDNGISPGSLPAFDLDLTTLQAGLRRRWELAKLTPFVAFGAGWTRIDSAPSVFGDLADTRWSASLAAGGRLDVSKRLGVRFEVRGYRVDLPDAFGSTVLPDKGSLNQIEGTTGLVFRF